MFSRLTRRGRVFRACGWLAVLLYLPVSTGIAVPVAGGKDLSTPFPCMDRQCGCRTAEQCWRSCCCHSLAQRLAWAEANDVEPPAFVRTASRQSKACCKPNAVPKSKSCCAPTNIASQQHDRSDAVSVVQAMKCRGVADTWLGISASVVPVATHWSVSTQFVGRVSCPDHDPVSADLTPPSPPPWA